MKNYGAKDVDSYIASSDIESIPKLEELRKIIKTTIPKVEERISWGVPFYRYHGLLAGFAVYKKHVSIGFPVTVLQSKDCKILEKKGYMTGKKTIQIKFNQKVPTAVIKQILRAQAKMNKVKESAKKRYAKADKKS